MYRYMQYCTTTLIKLIMIDYYLTAMGYCIQLYDLNHLYMHSYVIWAFELCYYGVKRKY